MSDRKQPTDQGSEYLLRESLCIPTNLTRILTTLELDYANFRGKLFKVFTKKKVMQV